MLRTYLVDGLEDERQQGLTIDVRPIASSRTGARAFVVRDTPGRAIYPQHGHRRPPKCRSAVNPDRSARVSLAPDPSTRHDLARFWGSGRGGGGGGDFFLLAVNKIDLVSFDKGRVDRSCRISPHSPPNSHSHRSPGFRSRHSLWRQCRGLTSGNMGW